MARPGRPDALPDHRRRRRSSTTPNSKPKSPNASASTFADRATTPGKRPIREIVGVDEQLNTRWSSRRTAIDTAPRAAGQARSSPTTAGCPTTVEMIKLSQQATLATRDAKHEPRSLAEQRAGVARPGRPGPRRGASNSTAMIDRVTTPAQVEPAPVTPGLVTLDRPRPWWPRCRESRATWRETNLDAEARRQVRYAGVSPAAVQDLATRVAEVAAGTEHSVPIGVDPEVAAPLPGGADPRPTAPRSSGWPRASCTPPRRS